MLHGTGADYQLVLNPDVELAPDAIANAMRWLDAHPDVGAVAPAVTRPDGTPDFLCKRYPAVFDLFLRGFAPALRAPTVPRSASIATSCATSSIPPATKPVLRRAGDVGLLHARASARRSTPPAASTRSSSSTSRTSTGACASTRSTQTAYLPSFRAVHHGGGAARKGCGTSAGSCRAAFASTASTAGGASERACHERAGRSSSPVPAASSAARSSRTFATTGRPFRAVVRGARAARRRCLPSVVALRDLATAPDAELDAVVAGASAIVHLAGRAHVHDRDAPPIRRPLYRAANVARDGSASRRRRCAPACARFVFASTVKVNGEATQPGRPFRPDDPPAPAGRVRAQQGSTPSARSLRRCGGHAARRRSCCACRSSTGRGVKGNFLALLDAVARGARAAARRRSATGASLLYVGNLVRRDRRRARCAGAAARRPCSSPTARASRCPSSRARSPRRSASRRG